MTWNTHKQKQKMIVHHLIITYKYNTLYDDFWNNIGGEIHY